MSMEKARFTNAGAVAWILAGILFIPIAALAQDEPPITAPAADSTEAKAQEKYPNQFIGHFAPGGGFDILRSERGSLNISVYGLFRYLNQMPGEQTFKDHLGRVRTVKAKH